MKPEIIYRKDISALTVFSKKHNIYATIALGPIATAFYDADDREIVPDYDEAEEIKNFIQDNILVLMAELPTA